jgi:hypothetical protein
VGEAQGDATKLAELERLPSALPAHPEPARHSTHTHTLSTLQCSPSLLPSCCSASRHGLEDGPGPCSSLRVARPAGAAGRARWLRSTGRPSRWAGQSRWLTKWWQVAGDDGQPALSDRRFAGPQHATLLRCTLAPVACTSLEATCNRSERADPPPGTHPHAHAARHLPARPALHMQLDMPNSRAGPGCGDEGREGAGARGGAGPACSMAHGQAPVPRPARPAWPCWARPARLFRSDSYGGGVRGVAGRRA